MTRFHENQYIYNINVWYVFVDYSIRIRICLFSKTQHDEIHEKSKNVYVKMKRES